MGPSRTAPRTLRSPRRLVAVTGPAPTAVPAAALRGLTAAAVLLSADVHLTLYATGYDTIRIVGPLFLLNTVGGLLLGLLVLVWRSRLPILGCAGFGAATLVGYVLSRTVGLFGFQEARWTALAVLAAGAEATAVLAAAAGWRVAGGRWWPRW